jgi:hypothetical protein
MIHGYSGFHYREKLSIYDDKKVSFSRSVGGQEYRVSLINENKEGSLIFIGTSSRDYSLITSKGRKTCNTNWGVCSHKGEKHEAVGTSSARAKKAFPFGVTPI